MSLTSPPDTIKRESPAKRPRGRPPSADARRRIENAALELFSQRGFHNVRLDEIAREAHASLQTIYRHYGDKQALLDACVTTWTDRLARRMADHLTGIETYRDRLRKVFWVVLDFFERYPKVTDMILGTVYPGSMGRDATSDQRGLTHLFLSVLAEGRDQGILTNEVSEVIVLDYFYGILARLVQMQALRHNQAPLTSQVDVLFEMLWRAITQPEAGDGRQ